MSDFTIYFLSKVEVEEVDVDNSDIVVEAKKQIDIRLSSDYFEIYFYKPEPEKTKIKIFTSNSSHYLYLDDDVITAYCSFLEKNNNIKWIDEQDVLHPDGRAIHYYLLLNNKPKRLLLKEISNNRSDSNLIEAFESLKTKPIVQENVSIYSINKGSEYYILRIKFKGEFLFEKEKIQWLIADGSIPEIPHGTRYSYQRPYGHDSQLLLIESEIKWLTA